MSARYKRYRPDLIGFQEVDHGNLTTYETELASYRLFLGPTTDQSYDVYNAIYWNPAVCDIAESGGFWLSTTPDRYSGSWDTCDFRAVTWVKLRHIPSDVTFLHLNTHLDDRSPLAKVEGSKVILQQLAGLTTGQLPVILTGDFNGPAWVSPDAAALGYTRAPHYQLFVEDGFVDAYLAAGHVDSATSYTYHHYQGEQYAPALPYLPARIDWIMTKDGAWRIQIDSCEIIRDQEPSLYPSDHYPVLVDLRFR